MARRVGLGPVFAVEWMMASRHWQAYAMRSLTVLLLLGAMAPVWYELSTASAAVIESGPQSYPVDDDMVCDGVPFHMEGQTEGRYLIVEHGRTRSLDAAPNPAIEIDEFLAPLLDVIPAQIFADALARTLGVGPGFRYIGKVVTRL